MDMGMWERSGGVYLHINPAACYTPRDIFLEVYKARMSCRHIDFHHSAVRPHCPSLRSFACPVDPPISPRLGLPRLTLSWFALLLFVLGLVLVRLVLPCHASFCLTLLSPALHHFALPCLVSLCLALPYFSLPYPALLLFDLLSFTLPRLASLHFTSRCLALPCLTLLTFPRLAASPRFILPHTYAADV